MSGLDKKGKVIGASLACAAVLAVLGVGIGCLPKDGTKEDKASSQPSDQSAATQRLQKENLDLRGKVAELEKKLATQGSSNAELQVAVWSNRMVAVEQQIAVWSNRVVVAEQEAKKAKADAIQAVYGPLAAQIQLGNDLLAILKHLNEPLTDLQKDEARKQLKGFIGDAEGRPIVLKGHVSKVKENLIGSHLVLNLEVLEGVKITFQADPNQKDVLEEQNASYEVAVLGRVKGSAIWLPGQHFKLAFVKPVKLEDYEKAASLLKPSGK